MTELGIDIETYSSEDLASCGVYREICEAQQEQPAAAEGGVRA